jgi:predicted MFS family arabinose efflux permease
VPLLLVPFVGSLALGIVCMFAAGLVSAPFVIAMFAIRQGSVDTRMHGRVFAITVSINAAGTPAGALLGGLLVHPVGVHRLLFGAGLGQLAAAGLAAALMRSGSRSGSTIAEPERLAA